MDSNKDDSLRGWIRGLMMSLLVLENNVALFLIYWMSKAICRQDFNTLVCPGAHFKKEVQQTLR